MTGFLRPPSVKVVPDNRSDAMANDSRTGAARATARSPQPAQTQTYQGNQASGARQAQARAQAQTWAPQQASGQTFPNFQDYKEGRVQDRHAVARAGASAGVGTDMGSGPSGPRYASSSSHQAHNRADLVRGTWGHDLPKNKPSETRPLPKVPGELRQPRPTYPVNHINVKAWEEDA
jgi:hypothetical protein